MLLLDSSYLQRYPGFMTGKDPYLDNPIDVLNAMAEQVGALRPQIEAGLADIALSGVSPEARDWNHRLSDAVELLDGEVTGIIDAINQTPMEVIDVQPDDPATADVIEESPLEAEELDDPELREFLERNPNFRISEIVAELYGLKRLPKEQFSALRKKLTRLERDGAILDIGDGIFKSMAAIEEPTTRQSEEDTDLDSLLKSIASPNVGAAKPRQRGRNHKKGRR